MSNESTQPFNINENTTEPSHRPEHDAKREAIDEEFDESDGSPITPADTSSAPETESDS